jgi:tetratricopeptide (TPR) repeat protein
MDTKQHVIYAQLAESYMQASAAKPAAEQAPVIQSGLDAYAKAIELKPDDAAYHNNYGLALAKAKKFTEGQEELNKAAALDPANAGRYYYNLGAVLVNTGNTEPAGAAFKKAIESDPNYADAYYQYGIYLIGKAAVDATTGKINPPDGTKEAFQKYLQLKPDGPNADAAKSMLQSIDASINTEYKNPAAPPAKKTTPKKK